MSALALIVVVVIDQFRTDELLRAQQQMNSAGISMLVKKGIFYDDAHHDNFFNMTCPGHVAISTGSPPGLSGIMINDDWDRKTHKRTYCVSDPDYKWIDADEDIKEGYYGSSAKRILTTTVGDEVKTIWGDQSKVISISLKDRSAIAMAGHKTDGVFWFAPVSNKWTTSTAYAKALPDWVKKFNSTVQGTKKFGVYDYGEKPEVVDDQTDFVLEAVKAEKLGAHKKPDLLWVSYSSHDFVGHDTGDDSKELHQMLMTEDRNIARLIKGITQFVGTKKKVIFVLTGDHGAGRDLAPYKELPGNKMNEKKTKEFLNQCLRDAGVSAGSEAPVDYLYAMNVFLSEKIKDMKGARLKAQECLQKVDGVNQAFTRDDILAGHIPQTHWLKELASSYSPTRGADVVGLLAPYWNSTDNKPLNHETPYDYDSWVPMVVYWNGATPKQVHRRVSVLSLAPTLARILETRRPSGSVGEYLVEVLDQLK